MVTRGSSLVPEAEETVLLFGSQALHLDAASFKDLRAVIQGNEDDALWVAETVASLPGLWADFVEAFPKYDCIPGATRSLQELEDFFSRHHHDAKPDDGDRRSSHPKDDAAGGMAARQPPLPNILLSPLTVISHLVEHGRYLDLTASRPQRVRGVLGFCTGLLSAFAVSGSKGRRELRAEGAKAVRLAMIIGGVVDAQDALDPLGTARALAVGWGSSETGDKLKQVLDRYPECYVSVAFDNNRATVTATTQTTEQLQKDLSAVGIASSEIGLHGRFHHAWYDDDLEALTRYCDQNPSLRLPDASGLRYPTWSNTADGSLLVQGPLHGHALEALLVERSEWYRAFRAAWSSVTADPSTNGESMLTTKGRQGNVSITSFGPERCVPPSMIRKHGIQALHMADILYATTTTASTLGGSGLHHNNHGSAASSTSATPPRSGATTDEAPRPRKDDDVAVVGMSIKVAGADDVDEFWELLCRGESQHQEVPADRLSFDNVWRERDEGAAGGARKWYGNFVRDHDAFDHKFFRKSAREMQSTDPQQRLMLQTAYQAAEQAGYFGRGGLGGGDRKIGCYIGVCSADYENNMACYAPNAFTAVGNLKSFIAGKISHWFGWLGPSLCIDSACSSSLVAVHYACRAVLSGECSAALAGGANIMTNSLWFQNLAAASFLSPTGQCKPFDAAADGYCRGEGFAAVVLKKMSDAIADGDQILGAISATAVLQNQNCTPVFVPNSPSLSDLFREVVARSGLAPQHITVAEAHGTGTQVGDPAEYAGLRDVLAVPEKRRRGGGSGAGLPPLALGSVKGVVGHTECASGAVSLVKTLLMVQRRMVPPQASFTSINPAIGVKPDDGIEVVTRLTPWDVPAGTPLRAAIINNYGASGSNASLVVTEAPSVETASSKKPYLTGGAAPEFPVRIFGHDERALKEYALRLLRFLSSANNIANVGNEGLQSISNLAFNLCRQTNPTLDKSLILGARSVQELIEKLSAFKETPDLPVAPSSGKRDAVTVLSAAQKPQRPVILCFGGQVSTFVGLDRQMYESSAVLRKHLDDCDAVCRSLPPGADAAGGGSSIYPGIFQREAVGDPVRLQTMLFAAQYACARSWIDSGVAPAALVGHSFGELVALCVSGCLSLADALAMVGGRARVIRESWGADSGAMMAVEGDEDLVRRLLSSAAGDPAGRSGATIACFNGPTSFTLAGTTHEIDEVARALTQPPFSSMRFKRLNVTNAFHSTLVEPLVPQLVSVGKAVTFGEPIIPLEFAVEHLAPRLDAQYVAQHMRQPVYFSQALQRLAARFPSAVYLEAGFGSGVTGMASRALGAPKTSHFQPLNITGGSDGSGGLQALTSTTLSLWRQGVDVDFWPHHRLQTSQYIPIMLPPYQFNKSRHWMEMKAPPKTVVEANNTGSPTSTAQPETPLGLFSFLEYTDKNQQSARFRVNTSTPQYKELVSGHLIARTAAICPATLIVDMAIEALISIRPELSPSSTNLQPEIHDVSNQAAICIDESRTVFLEHTARADKTGSSVCRTWDWKITSSSKPEGPAIDNVFVIHATGRLEFVATDEAGHQVRFRRLARLSGGHARCAALLLEGGDAAHADDDVLQGERGIYRAFAGVVDYAAPYRGLRRLVGRDNESAGRVFKARRQDDTWLGVHISDCFSQVGGIWVNCMTDCGPENMYIATGFEQWVRTPDWHAIKAGLAATKEQGRKGEDKATTWDVLAKHERASEGTYLTDIFVFEPQGGLLVEAILGINYHRVSKASMSKMLTRLTPGLSAPRGAVAAVPAAPTPTPRAGIMEGGRSETASGLWNADVSPIVLPPMENSNGVDSNKSAITSLNSAAQHNSRPQSKPGIDVEGKIRLILADICGLEPSEISVESSLAEIGIDSLMGMELGREMEGAFKTPLMSDELAQVTTFKELVTHVAGVLGVSLEAPALESGPSPGNESGKHSSGNTLAPAITAASALPSEKQLPPGTASNPPLVGATLTELALPPELVFEAFEETKLLTDKFIADYRCAGYMDTVLPSQTKLCVALAVEAFAQLGCNLQSAKPGAILERIPHAAEHERLVNWLYEMLADEARLLVLTPSPGGGNSSNRMTITRTAVSPPPKPSEAILAGLLREFPDHDWANRLTFFAGRRLADVLRGDQDGIGLIFGTDEGRELVSGLYGDSLLNRLANAQMRDILAGLVRKLKSRRPGGWGGGGGDGPLKIMELGAGTGGTTKDMVPMLAALGVPVEYTFTDLSGSFVAAARKTLGKAYPFMKFRVHDIEKEPAADLLGTQHVVIASNAIHATRSLATSLANVRKALRPDGFILMLEMTTPVHWVDLIFGLFEGWWLFEDGRRHAIAHQTRWRDELTAAGYGRLDWTDGWRPEVEIQRVMVAQASVVPGFSTQPSPMKFTPPTASATAETARDTTTVAQEAQIAEFVRRYSDGFDLGQQFATQENGSVIPISTSEEDDMAAAIAVTGATGSLGSHLVAHMASLPEVKTVYCLNRRSTTGSPSERQEAAFSSRGIILTEAEMAKLRVLAIDATKTNLGLPAAEYEALVREVTHIVHNAWPMSGKRAVAGFEDQFRALRGLVDLARDAQAARRRRTDAYGAIKKTSSGGRRTTFMFISSIAVVGHHSLLPGNGRFAPEERVSTAAQLLPNGYAQAKWACERILDQTLHRFPREFRACVVRPGQIAGHSRTGCWNEVEHLPFLVKSSQTLGVLPALDGDLCWTPVDAVAGALADLLLLPGDGEQQQEQQQMEPVYHVDNPVRQGWSGVLDVLSQGLAGTAISSGPLALVAFDDWVRRVRSFPGTAEDNPAVRLVDFLDDNFIRMSCGGMLLDTQKCCRDSPTLRAQGPVSIEVVKRYLEWWKLKGFLHV